MPLLAASGAQAADTATWDRVAECESDGVWSTNEDNGYYGGLQLTLSTWEKYGGTVYAERPELASRSQQIAVAEEIFAEEGPEAWPRCAESSGLTEESTEEPEINPGDVSIPTPTPALTPDESSSGEEEDASDQAESDERRQGESGGQQPEGSEQGGSEHEGSAGTSPIARERSGESTGTGKHRGEPDQSQQGEQQEEQRPDRSADRPGHGDGDYLVRSGDSLSSIAAHQGLGGGWTEIYAANESVIGDDPDLILPGQRLDLGKRDR